MKIEIKIKSFDAYLVDEAAKKIVALAKGEKASVSGPIPLPTRKEIVTILRSVHVNKKSREQFEMRTHKRLIDIIEPSAEVMNALLALELSAGVDVEIKQ